MNREECKRCVSGDGEASLTQRHESHVCHLLNGVVNVVADDSSPEQCRGIEGYLHPDITCTQAVGLNEMAAVSGNQPVVAESDESSRGNLGPCWPIVWRKPSSPSVHLG
jgi:hypothetical protein